MKRSALSIASLVAALFTTAAMADHNSPMGAGFAPMPYDVHNIQLEDDLTTTEFTDLISGGAVTDLENRYDTDTSDE